MSLLKGATKAAREFAKGIIRRKWTELPQLFTAEAQSTITAESLAEAFGWKQLEPRLAAMHSALTGEPVDPDNPLDPPKRFEIYEMEHEVSGELVRNPPPGHDPNLPYSWVEVDFLPSEDSGFDTCYNCFLAFVDEDGPRITAYAIESATE